jgi:hypothetical protein
MRYILALSVCFLLLGCGSTPQERVLAKIGNTSLFISDAEFLAAIRSPEQRDKKAIAQELQSTADSRRLAEAARGLFAGEQNTILQNMAETENSRLAQVYVYFYLQANMRHTNKALMDYYKKNKARFSDSLADSAANAPEELRFAMLREKIAADLFFKENPSLAAQVNDTNRSMILDSARRAMQESEIDRLKELYKVKLVEIEPPNLEEYYKANPEQFKTKTAYKLLRASDEDSSALANKVKNISTREEFAKIASEMPVAKSGHAIMDIGMFPALDAEISELGAKKFTKILRAPDTQLYYIFYIDSIIAPQLKPFDRARNLAKSIIESQGDIPLDSSVVLVTAEGKPFITEKEVLALRAKIPPFRAMNFRRSDALKSLVEEHLYARAAKEKSIDKSAEYIAWNRQLLDRAYIQVLMDSLVNKALGVPEDSLKAAYEAEKESLFAGKSFEDALMDIAVWLRIPDIVYKREFVLNRQNYPEEAASWEAIKKDAYMRIKYREFMGLQENLTANLQKDIPVSVVDDSWELEFMASDFEGISAQAKNQYETRNLQKAKTYLERARNMFPQDNDIQKTVAYELANIYQELGSYTMAVDEYRFIAGVWPQDPNTYKAYFMQGFVLSEYEKKDSLALLVFEEMLSKYPNSELSEDAKILVDNIKSGGKVLEDLIKKIEAQSEGER